jgi:hypothetical protein
MSHLFHSNYIVTLNAIKASSNREIGQLKIETADPFIFFIMSSKLNQH